MVPCVIEPFNEEHVEDAAKLFTDRYRIERGHAPFLPSRFENTSSISLLLRDLARESPGVVAFSNKRLVGFLIGRAIPSWRGRRSVYVPEWAHSAGGQGRRRIFEQMYSHLSLRWVADGCFTHLFTMLAHDQEIIDSLFWLGSGMAAVDAMLDLHSVEEAKSSSDVEIRRADLSDLESVTKLSGEFERYMAGPPIYLVREQIELKEYYKEWLSNPSDALWLASYRGEVVSYVAIGPFSEDAAYIISDEKTASIIGAYTKEHVRGERIGTALLNHSLNWARSQGYERCAVDFEPENVLASSFWLRRFQPICYSLVRHIDYRIALGTKRP